MPVLGFVETALLVLDFAIKLIAIGVVPEGRHPSSGNAWLLLILFVPLVGLPLYLLLGSPYVNRRRKLIQREANKSLGEGLSHLPDVTPEAHPTPALASILRMNRSFTGLPCLTGENVCVSDDYDGQIAALAAAIDRAERYVHVEAYIVSWDEVTDPVFRAMGRALERGVEVRLLLDHIGSMKYPGFWRLGRRLDRLGIQWRFMLPVQPWRGRWRRPDLRNHRKLAVIDGLEGFVSSLNLIAPWYGSARNRDRGRLWRDLGIAVRGEVVASLESVFAVDWYKETGERLPAASHTIATPPLPVGGPGNAFQVVPSGPGFRTEPNLRLFTSLIHQSLRRLVLVSPYFVPDESLQAAVTSAAHRGVEVDLFVNESPDQFMVGHAQASYYAGLLDAGVRIHLYPAPSVLHSKFVLVDDLVAAIGSSNLDMRSFGLCFEVTLLAFGGDLIGELDAVAQRYREASRVLTAERWAERPWHQRYLDNAFRLTSALQ